MLNYVSGKSGEDHAARPYPIAAPGFGRGDHLDIVRILSSKMSINFNIQSALIRYNIDQVLKLGV